MDYKIKIFKHSTEEYQQALQLRNKILREPIGLKITLAELKEEEEDTHFGLFLNGKIAACLMLTDTGNGKIKMRQVAVETQLQRKGLGKILSFAAEEFAQKKGYSIIFCHARKEAVSFYKKLGYRIKSDEFIEVGIPHYEMEKELTPAP